MNLLLTILLCGLQIINTSMNRRLLVVSDGDSNTDSSWFTADSSWMQQTELDITNPSTYEFVNKGSNGKKVLTMISTAPALIDNIFECNGVCILLGGQNDVYLGASADSTFNLIETYCNARRAAGWYMIVMTYPSAGAELSECNDSVRVNFATFADELIDLSLDPNIGDAADHGNATYFRDPVHLTPIGLSIVADSVIKHLEALR